MLTETRKKFNDLRSQMVKEYALDSTSATYPVAEPHAVVLNDRVQESSDFLRKINVMSVTDMTGTAMNLGVSRFIASRTNTDNQDRTPSNVAEFSALKYECKQTEWDVALPYKTIDALARFSNFTQRYSAFVTQQIALDRIRVGFHGQQAAEQTDPKENPNGEDVNKGWLQLLSEACPSNYLTQGDEENKIKLGSHGDYKNLDALVYDVYSMIASHNRTGGEVVILGRQLIAYDTTKIINQYADDPSKKQDITFLNQTYAGLPSLVVPSFPDTGILVTDLSNLSLYWLASGMRRQTLENAKRNRVEEYISSNDAYMLENPAACAAIEAKNLVFADAATEDNG